MSEPDPNDPTSTDEQLRRLLADARHTEPVPDDVVARLDAVLAELRDDPTAAPRRTTPVGDLAAARRRRNARTWLVAAVAAVAIGIGVNQLDLTHSHDTSSSAGDSASQAEDGAGSGAVSNGSGRSTARPQAETPSAAASAPAGDLDNGVAVGRVARLRSDRFGAQVRRLERVLPATDSAGAGAFSSNASARRRFPSCARPDGPGRVVPVRYDGQRAFLVYRPVRGDTQVVDLFLCGSDQPTRSITLSAR